MIHLLIGNTGAGKTTFGIALAAETGGVRFAIDVWMQTLFLPDVPDPIQFSWMMERVSRSEKMIWQVAEQVALSGKEVILEISMSTRELRNSQLLRAKQTGLPCTVYFLDVPKEIRRQRVIQRNLEKGASYSFDVSPQMFDFMEIVFEQPSPEEFEGYGTYLIHA